MKTRLRDVSVNRKLLLHAILATGVTLLVAGSAAIFLQYRASKNDLVRDLSLRTDTAVAPIHVEGTSRIMAKGKNWPKRARTTITFGTPMRPLPDEDSKTFGARIEAAVAALADESSTDWWTARKRAHAGRSPALTGPDAPAWRRAWMLGETTSDRRRSRRRWPDI